MLVYVVSYSVYSIVEWTKTKNCQWMGQREKNKHKYEFVIWQPPFAAICNNCSFTLPMNLSVCENLCENNQFRNLWQASNSTRGFRFCNSSQLNVCVCVWIHTCVHICSHLPMCASLLFGTMNNFIHTMWMRHYYRIQFPQSIVLDCRVQCLFKFLSFQLFNWNRERGKVTEWMNEFKHLLVLPLCLL